MRSPITNIFLILLGLLFACTQREPQQIADIVFRGGPIYTMDANQALVEAVAVSGDWIIAAGTNDEIKVHIGEETEIIDLEGRTMTPGLIETHGHMMGLGYNELNLDLSTAKNYDELVDKVAEAVQNADPGQWIVGRGWHQSKWDPAPEVMVNGFQTHDKLSAVSPDNPVWLTHASGHAGFSNAKAMEIAGINQMSIESFAAEVEGGEIIRDVDGNPTGVFVERAQGVIGAHVPDTNEESDRLALELAIKACQRNGITSFHDAGAGRGTMDLYSKFKEEGKLGTRMYVMISGPNRELTTEWLQSGPMIDTADHFLTIRSIKLNCDGALGSRGAWLLAEYTDRTGHYGHETLPMDYVLDISRRALQSGFQVCSHAIGDRANREVLDRYQLAFEEFPGMSANHRFRIEHAQHIDPEDIPRFGELGVIPAMQAIHMSSDRPWAIDRLGIERIEEGAYVWQKLLQTGARVINGTDVPVEPIDPIACFYASVARKTLAGTPEGGYESDQKMTRDEALMSYTLDAAYGEFEEDVKGSIEAGKLADFTVFSKDIMSIAENEILSTTVDMTILGGNIVYLRLE